MVLGLSSYNFLSTFSIFSTWFFLGPVSIKTYILWAQLLLDFSTDHLETMHTCSSWSEDVHIVLSLYFQLVTLFQLSGFLVVIWWRGSLWAQLKSSFIPNFLKLCRWFLPCSENMNVLLGWSSHHLLSICFHVFDVIQGQLVLEEIPCGCNSSYISSTWFVCVRVVLGWYFRYCYQIFPLFWLRYFSRSN